MNLLYQCKSNRIEDIEIQEGMSVSELRILLAGAGKDVNDSIVSVYNSDTGMFTIGDLNEYKLRQGDGVRFSTKVVDLANTAQHMAEYVAQQRKRAMEMAAEKARQDAAAHHVCSCSGTCPSVTVKENAPNKRIVIHIAVDGDHIEVTSD